MDSTERENWRRVEQALAANGLTDSFFFKRAQAIGSGKRDPFEAILSRSTPTSESHG